MNEYDENKTLLHVDADDIEWDEEIVVTDEDAKEAYEKLMSRIKKDEKDNIKQYSQQDVDLFMEMIPLMRDFAVEQNASLDVVIGHEMGTFIFNSKNLVFMEIAEGDKKILEYLKGCTVMMSPDKENIKIEVIHSFMKNKGKMIPEIEDGIPVTLHWSDKGV